ncbi:MAG: ATP-binding protein [Synergistaceae bacterium]|jgi:anti-sigma regulatory factor (Ser/Thr protein kinase)|nr:ATP-binding protein [Synergistaceae bacterium]
MSGDGTRETQSFRADIGEMENLYSFVRRVMRAHNVAERVVLLMEMAADEIFSNIVKYAYAEPRDAKVDVELRVGNGAVEMTFRDKGVPFDPTGVEPPDLTADALAREPGGLGVHMARSTVDELAYLRENGSNVLTLRKYV